MDHVWDGFYSGQLRKSRFPVIVDAFKTSIYDIAYSATPPKKQRFKLWANNKNTGLLVRIAYPDSVAYQVKRNGKVIEYNSWNDALKDYASISQTKCGENRYLGSSNTLEFYIT
jgi:hypothetical protein